MAETKMLLKLALLKEKVLMQVEQMLIQEKKLNDMKIYQMEEKKNWITTLNSHEQEIHRRKNEIEVLEDKIQKAKNENEQNKLEIEKIKQENKEIMEKNRLISIALNEKKDDTKENLTAVIQRAKAKINDLKKSKEFHKLQRMKARKKGFEKERRSK